MLLHVKIWLMFIKWFNIVRLRNVCLISIVLTKSFNLIPMSSKKSTEFFQSVRIFPTMFVRIFEKVIWEHWSLYTSHNIADFSHLWFCEKLDEKLVLSSSLTFRENTNHLARMAYARWEKWLVRRITKCHLYTSRFSRLANIFWHFRHFDIKCIAGFKLPIHLSFLTFWHVRALFRELFHEIANESLYISHNIADFVQPWFCEKLYKCTNSAPLRRFVKIPITRRERRNADWEKWLARQFTKCHP